MKLIILNDSDGHANAYEYTLDNMKRLLALVLEANKHNTMMDDPKQGQQLLQDPNVTAERIEGFMLDWNGPVGRSSGEMIYFVELRPDLSNVGSNPFI